MLTQFLAGNGQVLLANMTLYAPDGLQMIMMERFEGLTTAVDCKGDDGSMSLTFKSQEAFNYALQTWSYINENDDDRFLLIANHDGCGPDDQRQPYLITKVTEDTQDLTTFLTAQVAEWSEVAGTYDLDFGKASPSAPSARKLKERGFLSNVGTWSENPKVTFPMNVGTEGKRSNVYTDSQGRLTLDCVNCYVTGSFQVTGHLEVHIATIKEFTIEATPSGLAAELELEAVIKASNSPASLQFSKELFSFPIPDAGFEIKDIMKIGAILSYDVGASISLQGTGTVDFGLKSTIPDSANAVLNLVGSGQSGATGFSSSLDPVFDVKELSASVTLSAYSQPKLSVEIDVTKVGSAEASLSMKLPEVSVTLEADYEESGVCSQDSGSSKTGVKLSSGVTLELDADAALKFGDDNPSWSKQLWSWTDPLPGACYPINIPGLGPTQANATSVPTLPSARLTASASGTGSPATNGSSLASVTYTVPSAVPIKSQNNSLYIPSSLYRTGSSFPTGSAGSPGTIQAGTTGFPVPTSGPYGNSTLSSAGSGIASIATGGSFGSSGLSGTGSASGIIPTATSIGGSSNNVTSATTGQPANTFNGASLSGFGPSATNSSGSPTAGSTALTRGTGSASTTASATGSGASGTSVTVSSPTLSPPFPLASPSSSSPSSSSSSSSSSTKKAASTGTPATGSGGCKMRRGENGKRMLVC